MKVLINIGCFIFGVAVGVGIHAAAMWHTLRLGEDDDLEENGF